MKHLLPLTLILASCGPAKLDPESEIARNRKIMALQEKFDRFDYNADGGLTLAEVKQGVKESDVGGITNEEIVSLFKHYDVNKDGSISRWESQHAIDSPLPENQP
ncbi:EF-hand domain-containing protein [Haloferula rosea]|uniref:EF-hand domain-containing protein n=1 Tax=Haloferula rosea TaxID=490093 RepID=A0A934REY1_9BACT|nr:EF-hand domain-containing protein [Haloferula rosea]MBK1828403.1 EF-hand domain-containing protein [Haloferula rosea]